MTGRADEVLRRFAPRLAPDDLPRARELLRALAQRHADESAEVLAARFVARAAPMLAPAPRWLEDLESPPAITALERRLRAADATADGAPPELVDGLPVGWAAAPLDRATVVSWWERWERRASQPLFVYVHVPFCRTRCTFCQFASVLERGDHGAYLEAVLDEVRALADALGPLAVDALTVGGGTPSSLGEAELDTLLRAVVGPLARLGPDDYFSVELNPDSATEGKLRVLAAHGVNRVSLGVQSMHAATLHAVARGYQTADMVRDAVRAARRAGDVQVSLDLLAPLPEETRESFARGAEEVLDLGPDQLVLYRYQPVRRGRDRTIAPGSMPWDEAAARFRAEATERGYREVAHTGSSVVVERPDARRYRARYVQHPREPTALLGLGPFAESHVPGVGRYVAEEDGRRYRGEAVSAAFEEAAYVGRHLGAELPLDDRVFRASFGRSLREAFPEALAYLEETGELAREGDVHRPTLARRDDAARRAWLFLDAASVKRVRAGPRAEDRRVEQAARVVFRADGPPLHGTSARLVLDDVLADPSLADHLEPWIRARSTEARSGTTRRRAVCAAGSGRTVLNAESSRRIRLEHSAEQRIGARLLARLLAHGAADEPRALSLDGVSALCVRLRSPVPGPLRRLLAELDVGAAILPSEAAASLVDRLTLGGESRLVFAFRLDPEKSALLARVRAGLPASIAPLIERARAARYLRDATGEGALELEGVPSDEARRALGDLVHGWPDRAERIEPCVIELPLAGARPRLERIRVERSAGRTIRLPTAPS